MLGRNYKQMHVIGENLNTRYKSNSSIGKQSEDFGNKICILQANSEKKGKNGQMDTCILKNSGHDILAHTLFYQNVNCYQQVL